MASHFSSVQLGPPIEVFHVNSMYLNDSHPDKVNLSIGAYRTEEGKPWVLPVVHEAEKRLLQDASQNHEYLPVLGFEPFTKAATEFLLGSANPAVVDGRAFGVQCLSGTGSLRVGAEFLNRICGHKIVYMSKPSWENHRLVFRNAGFEEVREYTYWDQAKRGFNLEGMLKDLDAAPDGSVIILHGCAHNPTGIDPTEEQWKKIFDVVKRKKHFPFFDLAYQGFASGDPDRDAWAVRFFAREGLELVCSQSFAKNFGLYNERVGNLTIVVNDTGVLQPMKSQISLLIRANWSNPPNHGAKIVHMVLTNVEMKAQWFDCIKEMSGRIIKLRKVLRQKLEELKTPGTWNHITDQIGMFSYTGLNEKQVGVLTGKYHIYLLKSGRISMCGLNMKNIDHVAKAINDAVINTPDI